MRSFLMVALLTLAVHVIELTQAYLTKSYDKGTVFFACVLFTFRDQIEQFAWVSEKQ